jgi:hypothetical protein
MSDFNPELGLSVWHDFADAPNMLDAEAIHPFHEGRAYSQVDLGDRFAVEAIARCCASVRD